MNRWVCAIAWVLWPSFLAACLATLLFFAAVDPVLLRDAGPRVFADLDRERGYALGFFFFWLIAAVSSLLSLLLRHQPPGRGASPDRPPAGTS